MKILIVEDDRLTQAVLEQKLRLLGYRDVEAVSSGEEAVSRVAATEPDLILMDITLNSVIDGVEAAEQIRKQHDVPIIFVTIDHDDEVLKRAVHTEPYAFLVKPVSTAELRAALEVSRFKHAMDKERRQLTAQLQKALEHLKVLSGLLPICAHCKKIRDDKGYWTEVECYIRDHTDAEFTHGICPTCAEKVYAEIARFREPQAATQV